MDALTWYAGSIGNGIGGHLMKLHRALYGNVGIDRGECSRCKRMALVVEGEFLCCGRQPQAVATHTKRMSIPFQGRILPPKKDRERLLEEFDHRCAYCLRRFGSGFQYKGKPKRVLLAWDHAVPFMDTQNNNADNFLPACRTCNSWKSSRRFASLEEVRSYVGERCERESKRARE